MTWKNITLGKYQQIEAINSEPLPDIDKALYSACVVFDKTEYQLDNEKPKKVLKMMAKMQSLFETPFSPVASIRMGEYTINYDVSKITLGQYVELAYFISDGATKNAHYILATMATSKRITEHGERAGFFYDQPVELVVGAMTAIVKNFDQFNNRFKNLFGVDPNVAGNVQNDQFNKRYGWIYSATQVAQHEGITLDDAYKLPIIQAFNDLMFLKAKAKYEIEQLRNSKPVI